MKEKQDNTTQRKKEHLQLCLTDDVSFKMKSSGFEKYDFVHYAPTEIDLNEINFSQKFFKKEVNFPFIISCMTGGSSEAENINSRLAVAGEELKIVLGVGSQRQAVENSDFHDSFRVIRKNAPHIPILANIGAAQITYYNDLDKIKFIIDLVEADALVIHINPLQEMLQKGGEPNFKGFLLASEKIIKNIPVPLIAKEVGAGISKKAAKDLLEIGFSAIDVAGAGGTSWAGVELLRSKDNSQVDFWDWGLPTSYCIKKVHKLKEKFNFLLIGSGGINNAMDMAKAFALGADFTASARVILQVLEKDSEEGVVTVIRKWFDILKKVMFLTGSGTLEDLRQNKLIMKGKLF